MMMRTINDQVIETWQIHQRTMLLLLDNIPEDGMSATLSKRGGRDVSRQFNHIVTVRNDRLQSFAKKRGLPLTEFDTKDSPSKDALRAALIESGEAMAAYLTDALENNGAVSNFKRGAVPMLGYFISHEAHHRGNILLTLKESGIKRLDELKWGLWDWNKL